MESKGKEMMLH